VSRRIPYLPRFAVFSLLVLWCVQAVASTATPQESDPGAFLSGYYRFSDQGSRDLSGIPSSDHQVDREIARLAGRIRPALAAARTDDQVVDAFNRVLLEEEGFSYDRIAGDPENFLPGSVLSRKRGNCLGLSMLYLALAERLSVPFRGVCLPSHCFVRYEGKGGARNVEFASRGERWPDDRYRREFRIGTDRPYLQSLSGEEMLGVFLKSLGAAYSKTGREEDALRLYDEAVRFFPGLPEGHFNAGVSLQRLGRIHEAAVKYRVALSLDPGLAPARDNLGILLAIRGDFVGAIAEGLRAVELEPRNAAMRRNLATTYYASGNIEAAIREFRKAVELEPGNPRARAGLAKSYLALGRHGEANQELENAIASGVRIEPWLLEALDRPALPAHPES
jgi:tetratricopeptide (TPR) repeat protein